MTCVSEKMSGRHRTFFQKDVHPSHGKIVVCRCIHLLHVHQSPNKNSVKFQAQGQLQFEDKWPSMRPTVLKLLRQEPVTRSEWQDLFWSVLFYSDIRPLPEGGPVSFVHVLHLHVQNVLNSV